MLESRLFGEEVLNTAGRVAQWWMLIQSLTPDLELCVCVWGGGGGGGQNPSRVLVMAVIFNIYMCSYW